MTRHILEACFSSPDATSAFARHVGACVGAGDVLLLSGDIGAGKSHFARALILSRLAMPEDVPSPTFTLVQTYAAVDCEIWHVDLYRLSDPWDIVELGLVEAFEGALCLVEWPERLGDLAPSGALRFAFSQAGDGGEARRVRIDLPDGEWRARLLPGLGEGAALLE